MFASRCFSILCFVLIIQFSTSITITNHLKIALVKLDPFCVKDSSGNPRGFLVDLVQELLHRVNTSGTQTVTYETFWVNLDNESSEVEMWNMVRQKLLNGEADMALVPLVDTTGWNGVIQMSQPYMLTPFVPLVSKQVLGAQNSGRSSVLDKVRQGQVKGLYVNGSATAGLIDNDYCSPVKNLREAMRIQGNDSQVSTHAEGVSRVKDQPSRVVLFGEELRLKQYALQSKNCDLTFDWESVVGIGAYTLPISLYVQSQPLLSSINANLLHMRQDGTIALFKSNWWRTPADATCGTSETAGGVLSTLDTYF